MDLLLQLMNFSFSCWTILFHTFDLQTGNWTVARDFPFLSPSPFPRIAGPEYRLQALAYGKAVGLYAVHEVGEKFTPLMDTSFVSSVWEKDTELTLAFIAPVSKPA